MFQVKCMEALEGYLRAVLWSMFVLTLSCSVECRQHNLPLPGFEPGVSCHTGIRASLSME